MNAPSTILQTNRVDVVQTTVDTPEKMAPENPCESVLRLWSPLDQFFINLMPALSRAIRISQGSYFREWAGLPLLKALELRDIQRALRDHWHKDSPTAGLKLLSRQDLQKAYASQPRSVPVTGKATSQQGTFTTASKTTTNEPVMPSPGNKAAAFPHNIVDPLDLLNPQSVDELSTHVNRKQLAFRQKNLTPSDLAADLPMFKSTLKQQAGTHHPSDSLIQNNHGLKINSDLRELKDRVDTTATQETESLENLPSPWQRLLFLDNLLTTPEAPIVSAKPSPEAVKMGRQQHQAFSQPHQRQVSPFFQNASSSLASARIPQGAADKSLHVPPARPQAAAQVPVAQVPRIKPQVPTANPDRLFTNVSQAVITSRHPVPQAQGRAHISKPMSTIPRQPGMAQTQDAAPQINREKVLLHR